MIQKQFMQKSGIVTIELANFLAAYEVGARIPSVSDLSIRFQVARRNIQIGLKNLEELDAVLLESHGRLGTFLKKIDYQKLLEICRVNSLLGVLPLPYTKRYEGLATGIYKAIDSTNGGNHLAFLRGSKTRYEGLLQKRYDFVVMSRFAFERLSEADETDQETEILLNFGDYSYVGGHALFTPAERKGNTICRVGVDGSSEDQMSLTKEYFRNQPDIEFVPIIYSQVLSKLQTGAIEACIWNIDDIDPVYEIVSVERIECENTDDTQAVIVVRKEDALIKRFLTGAIDRETVRKTQQDVMNDKMIPYY